MTDLSPAAELRQAAAKIRADSEEVPSPPWKRIGGSVIPDRAPESDERYWVISISGPEEWARYILAWQPAVALAVADWLEATAEQADNLVTLEHPVDGSCVSDLGGCEHAGEWFCGQCLEWRCHCWDAALKVARAYSGTEEVTGARS